MSESKLTIYTIQKSADRELFQQLLKKYEK